MHVLYCRLELLIHAICLSASSIDLLSMNNLEYIITQNRVRKYKHMGKIPIKPFELIIEIIKQNNEKSMFFLLRLRIKKQYESNMITIKI